jgi:hypothetical protein
MDTDKCERKLASLLVEGASTDKDVWNALRLTKHHLRQLKKKNPVVYYTLMAKYFGVLKEIKDSI